MRTATITDMGKMRIEVAQQYCTRLGDAFVEALWNRELSGRAIAEQFALKTRTVVDIRTAIVPSEHRQTRTFHMKNPEFLAALASSEPTNDIAKRFGLDRGYVNKHRIHVRGRLVREPLKLTASVVALLKSKLSNKDVGIALGLNSSTVTHHRKALGVPIMTRNRTTAEEQALILAAPSISAAMRLTGVPYTTCRDIRVVAQGLPRRPPKKKRVKKITSVTQ